jgi:hypothetical protein
VSMMEISGAYSRTSILPLATCFSLAFAPPPRVIVARNSRSCSIRSFIAAALSLNSADVTSTSERRTDSCSAWKEWACDATPRARCLLVFSRDWFQALFIAVRSTSGFEKDILNANWSGIEGGSWGTKLAESKPVFWCNH